MKKSYFAAQPDGNKDLVGSQTDINFHTIMFVMFVMLTKKKKKNTSDSGMEGKQGKERQRQRKKVSIYNFFCCCWFDKKSLFKYPIFLRVEAVFCGEKFGGGVLCGGFKFDKKFL